MKEIFFNNEYVNNISDNNSLVENVSFWEMNLL
jgi:hypothetical protein